MIITIAKNVERKLDRSSRYSFEFHVNDLKDTPREMPLLETISTVFGELTSLHSAIALVSGILYFATRFRLDIPFIYIETQSDVG